MKTKTIYTDEHGPVVSMDDFDIMERENQSLRSELQKLQNDLDDALDIKNGSGPTALSRLSNELQKQKELNAELVEGLKMSRDLMKTHVPSSQTGLYVEWIEARDIIESLIKKYKESWK